MHANSKAEFHLSRQAKPHRRHSLHPRGIDKRHVGGTLFGMGKGTDHRRNDKKKRRTSGASGGCAKDAPASVRASHRHSLAFSSAQQ